jgi:DNA (cytosine-5)-methyltransferase 1
LKTQPAGWPKPAAFIHPNILEDDQMRFKNFEFFSRGGMARAGLGPAWQCLYANDFDAGKAATYRANWGPIDTRDIAQVRVEDLPLVRADLAWASPPCQDLSCAGTRLGLDPGTRSAAFWPFVDLLQQLGQAGRLPRLIVVENVVPSKEDEARMTGALKDVGYRIGVMTIDAKQFVPQSRKRMFIVGAAHDVEVPAELIDTRSLSADSAFHWRLSDPPPRTITLSDLIDFNAPGRTRRLIPTTWCA